ncbi:hypothetical protein [Sinosporangium siamense]|uniref:Uncharacterized protein n=1 Tax=Sinosporangium siamense TaxID=1367973 RepID=A0A919VDH6_9ACTN|nr:hypothetical protein [Sinosporangium siamense]GII94144.1 hypothetical protein Ssi02_43750 [Sinosporangium siamense]
MPEGDAPLVLAGLSSSFMNQRTQLDRIAEALGTLPVRGLMTTGPAVDPATIRASGNVLIAAVDVAALRGLRPKGRCPPAEPRRLI